MTRLEFGLEHLGADLMEDVPDLEFGLAENLGVGLGREQAGHLEDVLFHRLEDDLGQFLGVGFLLGGQFGDKHRGFLVDKSS